MGKKPTIAAKLRERNKSKPAESLSIDRERAKLAADRKSIDAKYKAAIGQIDTLEKRVEVLTGMSVRGASRQWQAPRRICHGKATGIAMLSDWHVEQCVRPERVSGLGEFNLEIADQRIKTVSERTLLMLEDARHLVPIRDLVVWLGGDFIHGQIHEEHASDNTLHPFEACRWVCERLEAMLRQFLRHGGLRSIVVATSHGNHGRTTRKMPEATAAATSYEHNMYLQLRGRFIGEPKIGWQIAEGYFNYVDVYQYPIRFHHGNKIKFSGGINGVGVPAFRFISHTNTKRRAYLDGFGHFHTFSWPGLFVSNGSLPGIDEYSETFSGDAVPKQAFAVIDRERGITRALPVFAT